MRRLYRAIDTGVGGAALGNRVVRYVLLRQLTNGCGFLTESSVERPRVEKEI